MSDTVLNPSRKRKQRTPARRLRFRLELIVFVLLFAKSSAPAAEIASNGIGGGAWSDPTTWRGRKVPTADDDVVIQKNDVVTFGRGDGKPTCRKLQIDPKGGLTFKTGAGKLVFTVSDGIETFGAIRLDGTKSASDEFEIRLIGDAATKRVIKLGKGGALLLYGRANLPDGKRNVALVAPPDKEQAPGLVECNGAAMIDWQRATIKDVKLYAIGLDNTGAKANERLIILAPECRASTVRGATHRRSFAISSTTSAARRPARPRLTLTPVRSPRLRTTSSRAASPLALGSTSPSTTW